MTIKEAFETILDGSYSCIINGIHYQTSKNIPIEVMEEEVRKITPRCNTYYETMYKIYTVKVDKAYEEKESLRKQIEETKGTDEYVWIGVFTDSITNEYDEDNNVSYIKIRSDIAWKFVTDVIGVENGNNNFGGDTYTSLDDFLQDYTFDDTIDLYVFAMKTDPTSVIEIEDE